jgi:hypothetical protein
LFGKSVAIRRGGQAGSSGGRAPYGVAGGLIGPPAFVPADPSAAINPARREGGDKLRHNTVRSTADDVFTPILNPDGSVRPVRNLDRRVYEQLGAPPIVTHEHNQLEAAALQLPTPADLLDEKLAAILNDEGLMPGSAVFQRLIDGSGLASRHASILTSAVTMVSGDARQYALQNGGLGYRLLGQVAPSMDPAIAADSLVFAPALVRAWESRMRNIDSATALVPWVNDSRDVYEVFKGKDLVTDEDLHWWGGRGITLVSMGVPIVAGAWFRRAGNAAEEAPLVGLHGRLSKIQDGRQAHHINQYAVYKHIIARNDGVSVKIFGDAINDVGSPHYNVHEVLAKFWDRFYEGGPDFKLPPTNLELTRAQFDALIAGGFSRDEALMLIRHGIRQRVQYGILGGNEVPRRPNKFWQAPR